jgi:predicted dehydrogenase
VVVENWMYANSIHVIDYLIAFGRGGVKSVDVIRPWAGEASNVVLAKIDFHSGDVGLYEGIWQGPGPWAVTVSTPAKRWEFRPLENAVFQVRGERRLQPTEPHPWDKQFKSGFRRQAEEVVRALGGQPSQAPTLEQSLDTMRLIAAIFRRK